MKTAHIGHTILSYLRKSCSKTVDPAAWDAVPFAPTAAEWMHFAFQMFGKDLLFYGKHLPDVIKNTEILDVPASEDLVNVLITDPAIYDYLESAVQYTDIVRGRSDEDFDHRVVFAIECAAAASYIGVWRFFVRRVLSMDAAQLENFDLIGDDIRRRSPLVVDSAHERLSIAHALETGQPIPCSAGVRIKTAARGWDTIPAPSKKAIAAAKKMFR
jgi:hypothetical protein